VRPDLGGGGRGGGRHGDQRRQQEQRGNPETSLGHGYLMFF
jgi:hypothetical protein